MWRDKWRQNATAGGATVTDAQDVLTNAYVDRLACCHDLKLSIRPLTTCRVVW